MKINFIVSHVYDIFSYCGKTNAGKHNVKPNDKSTLMLNILKFINIYLTICKYNLKFLISICIFSYGCTSNNPIDKMMQRDPNNILQLSKKKFKSKKKEHTQLYYQIDNIKSLAYPALWHYRTELVSHIQTLSYQVESKYPWV